MTDMNKFFKRSWAQINLDNLKSNFEAIRERVSPSSNIMAIVKADAYGHGYERVVNELKRNGCDWFGVSNLEEALQVRAVCDDKPILILGYTPPEYASQLALNNISQTVFDSCYGRSLSQYAAAEGVEVCIHIKIDTGMTRLGFLYQDNGIDCGSIDMIESVCSLPNLYSEGIFTHFASADEADGGELFTRLQHRLFLDAVERLRHRGVSFDFAHCCNSAATLLYPEMHLDMVRVGIILFGLYPSAGIKNSLSIKPVMELKTVVSMIKTVSGDTPVSYGRTYFTSGGETKIATVPVGYADGYPRALSGYHMLCDGKKAPIIGRICMDQCMLDVTGIDVCEGKTITVFGKSGGNEITVDTLAARLGTVNYELICNISKRVPRIYMRNDEIESITDYISF